MGSFIIICFLFLIVAELYQIMQNQCELYNLLCDLKKGAKSKKDDGSK